jgi:hypothetical protein
MKDCLLIYYKKTNTVVAVIEYDPTLVNDDVKGRWLATMGMTTNAAKDFRVDFAPIIPAAHIRRFEPIKGEHELVPA